ncbi:MAG: ABC transporter permease, partial [Actinomycetota bacterium]|nr:ABC transporter permease [Actinomycetota bacterium]
MDAVRARVRADLRARWRAWLGLALLVGVLGGVVMTAAAAARRTETALWRLVRASRAPDALISPQNNGFGGFDADVARLPEVADIGEVAGAALARIDDSGQVDPLLAAPPASVDGRTGYSIYRPKVLSGRMPRRDREAGVLALKGTADRLHLKVGSRFSLVELSAEENNGRTFHAGRDRRRFTFTVVGIGVFVDSAAGGEPVATENLLLTPAWFRANADPSNLAFTGAFLRLRPGADLARLREEIDELASRHPETGSNIFFSTFADRYTAERRAIRPQAVALWAFAALAGAAALLVVGQAMSRVLVFGAPDHAALRALGMNRGQLLGVSVIPATGIAAAGAVVAAVGA